ncbi:MAG: hypothetical protein AAGG01_22355 [Planctomycetota bacterium]
MTVYVAPPEYFSVVVDGHEGVLRKVAKASRDFLMDEGFKVLSTDPFRDAWTESESKLGGLFDPQTGLVDQSKQGECYRRTVALLRRRQSFDAVLIPSVEYANLELEPPYRRGSWAGVVRRVQFDGALTETRWTSMLAMTLKPRLLMGDGDLVFESAAGLDFAQKTVWTLEREIRLEPKDDGDFRNDEIQRGRRAGASSTRGRPSFRRVTCGAPAQSSYSAGRAAGLPVPIPVVHESDRDSDQKHARTEHVEGIASAAGELESDAREGNEVEGWEQVLHRGGGRSMRPAGRGYELVSIL